MHARLLRPITMNPRRRIRLHYCRMSQFSHAKKENQCCLLLVTNTSDVPKVISINALLLHSHSLSEQKGAGIFYSERSVLVTLQTVVREDTGSGAEEGLF